MKSKLLKLLTFLALSILFITVIGSIYFFRNDLQKDKEKIVESVEETINSEDKPTEQPSEPVSNEPILRNYKITTEWNFLERVQFTEEAYREHTVQLIDEIYTNNMDLIRCTTKSDYLEENGDKEVIYKEYQTADNHIVYDNYNWITPKNKTTITDLYPIKLLNSISTENNSSTEFKIMLDKDIVNQLFDFNSYHVFMNLIVEQNIEADVTVNEQGKIESLSFEIDGIPLKSHETINYENIEFKINYEYDTLSEVVISEEDKKSIIETKYNEEYTNILKEYLKQFRNNQTVWPTEITLDMIEKSGITLNYLNNCDRESVSKKVDASTYVTTIISDEYKNEIVSDVLEIEKKKNITILNVYINDSESTFSEEDIKKSELGLQFELDIIKNFGNFYGIDINFTYNEKLRYVYNSEWNVPATGRDGEPEESEELTNAIFNYLEENSDEYNSNEETFIILNVKKEGRSFAIVPSLYTYVYYDWADVEYIYAHELLHMFGAGDMYSMSEQISEKYYHDIMNSYNEIRCEYSPCSAFDSKWLPYLDKSIYDITW